MNSPYQIIYRDAHLLAALKPAGIASHSVDGKTPAFVELLAQQTELTLGTHQRLDAATSGLMLFSTTSQGAKALAALFEQRQIRKFYRALLVTAAPLAGEGSLRHRLQWQRNRQQIATSGGDEAITHYRLIAAAGPFALCEIEIETGRTHQIRAQFAAINAPVLGDTLYGGGDGSGRLMLHAWRLDFTHPFDGHTLQLEAPTPALLDSDQLELVDVVSAITAHHMHQRPSDDATTAFRVFSGMQAGIPGVRLDRYGEVGILRVYEGAADPQFSGDAPAPTPLSAALARAAGVSSLYRLVHHTHAGRREGTDDAGPQRLVGDEVPTPWTVCEQGIHYLVDHGQLGCGLYLDQAHNRCWIAQQSAGAQMLNLFAYTASFSVVAAVHGAAQTTSVDLSAKALAWARANFAANGLSVDDHRFYRDDVLKLLGRLQRRGECFDLIVCDPPSFARRGRSHFSVAKDWPRLTAACVRVAAPHARLLLCTNHAETTLPQLRNWTERAVSDTGRRIVSCDAWEDLNESGTCLKSLRVSLD